MLRPKRKRAFGAPRMRVARPSNDLDLALKFWEDLVGLNVLSRFENHSGFDGVILGDVKQAWELELTRSSPKSTIPTPTNEDIIVLYMSPKNAKGISQRLRDAGYPPRGHVNPYWEKNGATTHTDPDGYTLIIFPLA